MVTGVNGENLPIRFHAILLVLSGLRKNDMTDQQAKQSCFSFKKYFQIINKTTDSKHLLVRQKPKLIHPGEWGYAFGQAAPPCVAINSTLC
jgi:hypothetical protein